jgi:hypothetical protein
LESPDGLFETHGDRVEVLNFIDLALESIANLHLLLAVGKGPSEVHSV